MYNAFTFFPSLLTLLLRVFTFISLIFLLSILLFVPLWSCFTSFSILTNPCFLSLYLCRTFLIFFDSTEEEEEEEEEESDEEEEEESEEESLAVDCSDDDDDVDDDEDLFVVFFGVFLFIFTLSSVVISFAVFPSLLNTSS